MMLIVGPCYDYKDPVRTGGIVVLFEEFIRYCESHGYDFEVIDTNKGTYRFRICALLAIYGKIIKAIFKCDSIFLHGTMNDYVYIVPFITVLSKLLNKKVYLRKFAGNFDVRYHESNVVCRQILTWCLKSASLLFWETKNLVKFGMTFNIKSFWYPNVRNRYIQQSEKSYNKRLVFISQVMMDKGIDELIKVSEMLPSEYVIHIYGPIVDKRCSEEFFIKSGVEYRGVLNASEVPKTLAEYDLLVLPTKWRAEGYPGVIIEAFSVGIPVISTYNGGIPEIVSHGKNGLLVPPGNTKALLDAIMLIDASLYDKLRAGAYESFGQFDAEIVNAEVMSLIVG
ncbi:MAG: glycosyltransferase family 4 protein [Bacteroidales bacterium]|nr:glycosyltransferase family 4 protein [Bacteroidales bacterium]